MEIPPIVGPAGMLVTVGGSALRRKKVYPNAKSLSVKFGVARKVIAVSCP